MSNSFFFMWKRHILLQVLSFPLELHIFFFHNIFSPLKEARNDFFLRIFVFEVG